MFDTAREAGRYPDRISFVAALRISHRSTAQQGAFRLLGGLVQEVRVDCSARTKHGSRGKRPLSDRRPLFLQAGPIERRASPSR